MPRLAAGRERPAANQNYGFVNVTVSNDRSTPP